MLVPPAELSSDMTIKGEVLTPAIFEPSITVFSKLPVEGEDIAISDDNSEGTGTRVCGIVVKEDPYPVCDATE